MMLDAVGTWIESAYILSALSLGLAWAVTAVLARRTAAARHHVWVVALTVALVAPVAREVVPHHDLPLLRLDEAARPRRSTPVTPAELARPETLGEVLAPVPSQWSATTIPALVWLIGAIPLLCVRALRRIRLSRLAAEASVGDGQANVRWHPRVSVPMLAGFRRPTILLPMSAARWPVDAREAVLAHERAHVQRYDHVTALVSDVATIVYWLNPLAWIAAGALEREREAACDDEVLLAGVKPSVYAAALLRVAQMLPVRRTGASVPSIGGARLDARIRAVLRHRTPNSGRAPLSWPATIALIGVCAVLVASVRLVARTHHQTPFAERPMSARDMVLSGPPEPAMASLPGRRSSGAVSSTVALDEGVIAKMPRVEINITDRFLAQESTSPAFEVASIKPTKVSGQTFVLFNPGGRFRAVNSTMRFLIRQAYQLQDGTQVFGGPGWLDSDAFDIDAKAADNAAPAQLRSMLRTLLAERFKLTFHDETRDFPIYALTIARNDGKMGSQFRPASEADCVSPPSSPDQLVPFDRRHPLCGVLYSPVGYWTGRRVPVDTLANALSRVVSRTVVNRTGLAGTFDLDLRWTDLSMLLSPAANPGDPLPQADGPSLFTALQEQLGLRLESTRGPVRVLVIDRAEHPTED